MRFVGEMAVSQAGCFSAAISRITGLVRKPNCTTTKRDF